MLTKSAFLLAGSLWLTTMVASGQADLKLDGAVALTKPLGSNLLVELRGTPLMDTLLYVDLSPGPLLISGRSVPLEFSCHVFAVSIGPTDATGLALASVPLFSNPNLAGKTYYLAGAVMNPAQPIGYDLSNGASITLSSGAFIHAELAGNSLTEAPYFERVRAINQGATMEIGADTFAIPSLVDPAPGVLRDLYVVAAKTPLEWSANPSLLAGSFGVVEQVEFFPGGIEQNRFLVDPGLLQGPAAGSAELGAGYDLVIDMDQDGTLSAGDVIDGYSDTAGVFVVRDPSLPGPYAVTTVSYIDPGMYGAPGDPNASQEIYFPSAIGTPGLTSQPLVVISHGSGHQFTWYDHIGEHLASYGYVVMSHDNTTSSQNVIRDRANNTIGQTDLFLGSLQSPLAGNLDPRSIVWIGHSQGAEGVVYAYDLLVDCLNDPACSDPKPIEFGVDDIKLISSIAPTTRQPPDQSNPHGVNYHLWVGQSDTDVSGHASDHGGQSFRLLDRAEDQSQSISIMGAGHSYFHNGPGSSAAAGPPPLLTRAEVHAIMRGYLVPLLNHYVYQDWAARDFLTRQYESFRPISAMPSVPNREVDLQYRDSYGAGTFVIDHFQTSGAGDPSSAAGIASSGALVTMSVLDFSEGVMDDNNNDFEDYGSLDPFNGFTQSGIQGKVVIGQTMGCRPDQQVPNPIEQARGVVFSVDGASSLNITYEIPCEDSDWTTFDALSFRACQGTQHSLTRMLPGDTSFEVELEDEAGQRGRYAIDWSGAGITQPYQRKACETALGWANEFETIRMPLWGFRSQNPFLNLSRITKLRFLFGAAHGTAQARLGLDDIVLTSNEW